MNAIVKKYTERDHLSQSRRGRDGGDMRLRRPRCAVGTRRLLHGPGFSSASRRSPIFSTDSLHEPCTPIPVSERNLTRSCDLASLRRSPGDDNVQLYGGCRLPGMGAVARAAYSVAGALRLARFNIDTRQTTDFIGFFPSPQTPSSGSDTLSSVLRVPNFSPNGIGLRQS